MAINGERKTKQVALTSYCRKCGREVDAGEICPLCGTAESIAFLPEEQQKAILAAAEAAENARL